MNFIKKEKNWNKEYPLTYWKKESEKILMNEKLKNMLKYAI